ncbi:hypothetical protein CSV61_16415 [Sporosarcina sp. P3]|uniref:hypothetical protein n=1 Tax=Sporosarcina sp. P3 TaxID=2048245 RepID=UPI000C16DF32|nr:hypothetical protein [Sporosarcina sp. P3]PID20103.1 hypothetical protein CSV61_16415 [Sporosarcina sp. P3]
MKNKIVLSLCLTVVTGLLFACGSENLEKDVKATFVGIIEEIHSNGTTASVSEIEPNENKIVGPVVINLPAITEQVLARYSVYK